MVKQWSMGLLSMIIVGGLLSVVAIISTNHYLAASIIYVFLIIIILYSLDRDGEIEGECRFPGRVKAEETVEFSVFVNSGKGFGLFMIEFPLHEAFLLREGTNIHIFFKGFSPYAGSFEFKGAGMRRGTFLIRQVNYTYYPAMGIINSTSGSITVEKEIEVLPKISAIKLRRNRMYSNRYTPRNTISRIGPVSSDFESVREYQPGDPYRHINWKATARSPSGKMMVNRYEMEGEKTVIYILDRSFTMTRGTTEENPLEYSIAAIFSHSRLLMQEGVNTGFWTAQSGKGFTSPSVVPSSGAENEQRFKRALLLVEPTESRFVVYSFDPRLLAMIKETGASIIFFTSIWKENSEELSKALMKLIRYNRNIVLVNVISTGIISKHLLGGMEIFVGRRTALRMSARYLRNLPSVRRIDWEPAGEGQGSVISAISRVIGA
ncbi:MAG: DUF58 domain-containing protein [Candidatus Thermoplasmatota archaeon]|nr:DUF58 domain-containing protein [Candidatus Thermoplasmatota archaeon]MCL5731454.1 DUF58 domain-containing protein [Candidatus Thermoplasmatota archaeon]